MAVKNYSATYAPNVNTNGMLVVWPASGTLANGDSGAPFEGDGTADFADRTVQITGTFGAGGSVNFEGSNDGTNWFVLTDPQGNNITKTAAALEVVEEGPRFFRPNVTAGDGTTAITVTVWMRRNR